MERRIVELSLAPPKRLLASLRWRSSKIRYDQDVWDMAMSQVYALRDAGWMVRHVQVEWGKSQPGTPREREQMARGLTGCGEGCGLAMTCGAPGRGSTTIALEREDGAEALADSMREVFRVTALTADGMMHGERWDSARQCYRATKPVPIRNGIQEVAIDYVDDTVAVDEY